MRSEATRGAAVPREQLATGRIVLVQPLVGSGTSDVPARSGTNLSQGEMTRPPGGLLIHQWG